jgi:ribonuclease P protein subunit POP4
MISPQNVIRHELIGLDVLVVHASNPAQTGISGRIIDETRNMLIIAAERGVRRIPKHLSVFRITLPDGRMVEVNGSVLVMASEKRITVQIKNRGT